MVDFSVRHATLWEGGTISDLGILANDEEGGRIWSGAYAVNKYDQIAGYGKNFPVNTYHAFLLEDGVMQDLGPFGTNSEAYSINDSGQVVGIVKTGSSGTWDRAFLWENEVMNDLGTLGGNESSAWDINNSGQIVGKALIFPRKKIYELK